MLNMHTSRQQREKKTRGVAPDPHHHAEREFRQCQETGASSTYSPHGASEMGLIEQILILQKTVGNRAIQRHLSDTITDGSIQRRKGDRWRTRKQDEDQDQQNKKAGSQNQQDLAERLDEIEARYRQMILGARANGWYQAAANLEYFLSGKGAKERKRQLPVEWIRSFQTILDAERENETRFQSTLNSKGLSLDEIARKIANNQSSEFSDYWDKQVGYEPGTELYFASGDSTLSSRGTFALSRRANFMDGRWITISGTVLHRWHDPYDWHAGLTANIPLLGTAKDDDAILMERHRGAASFEMESIWTKSVHGIYNADTGESTYRWEGPR